MSAPIDQECYICGRPADSWDHVIPRHYGGRGRRIFKSNEPEDNKEPCCRRCNQLKGAFTLPFSMPTKQSIESPFIWSLCCKYPAWNTRVKDFQIERELIV